MEEILNCKCYPKHRTCKNHSTFEPPHNKTNKMTCAPSEDTDQPRHPPSLIRSLLSAWGSIGSLATHWAHSEDSDQTARMPRQIWVFAGHTCHFVGFVILWLSIVERAVNFRSLFWDIISWYLSSCMCTCNISVPVAVVMKVLFLLCDTQESFLAVHCLYHYFLYLLIVLASISKRLLFSCLKVILI